MVDDSDLLVYDWFVPGLWGGPIVDFVRENVIKDTQYLGISLFSGLRGILYYTQRACALQKRYCSPIATINHITLKIIPSNIHRTVTWPIRQPEWNYEYFNEGRVAA